MNRIDPREVFTAFAGKKLTPIYKAYVGGPGDTPCRESYDLNCCCGVVGVALSRSFSPEFSGKLLDLLVEGWKREVSGKEDDSDGVEKYLAEYLGVSRDYLEGFECGWDKNEEFDETQAVFLASLADETQDGEFLAGLTDGRQSLQLCLAL